MTQKEALNILKSGYNVFLTGQAGSGKTFVLNEYTKYLREEGIAVGITASTGIAATHIGGVTIHSWAGIGVKDFIHPTELEAMEEKQYLWNRLSKAQVLIIDEVSMLGGNVLDMVEQVCRFFKRSDEPFGGMQVVLCGDLFQLPPITKFGKQVELLPMSRAWKTMDLKICYLEEQHRQQDAEFTTILNEIRTGKVGDKTIKTLETRYLPSSKANEASQANSANITRLFTHNADVDAINTEALAKLPGNDKVYRMVSKGKEPLVEALKKSCLAPDMLYLKKNAVVMFVKNSFEQNFVNGTLGKIVSFDRENNPVVETLDGRQITASAMTWSVEENGKVLAEVSQVPLRLAWAITVHKSQGMSLDAAEIDLSKTFVTGQGYVALSRLRTLKGLTLLGLNKMALEIDPEILNFDVELRAASEAMARYITTLSAKDIKTFHNNFLIRFGITTKKAANKTYSVDKIRGENKSAYAKWTPEEEGKLKKLYQEGQKASQIAKVLGRQIGGINSRLKKLGLE